jgi:hypothetical protein
MKTTRDRVRVAHGVVLGIGLLAMTARCSSSSSSGGPGGGDDGGSNDSAAGNDSTVGGDDGSHGDEGTGDTGPGGHDAAPADASDATTVAQDAPVDSPVDTGPGIADVNLPDVSFFDAGDGGVCNSLANGAGLVQPTRVIGTLPAGTGGTVEEGLYYLTAVTEYVVPEGGADAGTPGNAVGETVELVSQGSGTFPGPLGDADVQRARDVHVEHRQRHLHVQPANQPAHAVHVLVRHVGHAAPAPVVREGLQRPGH